ncbi:uncharacterized protein LOC103317726 [Nasonia vitripennis]|uniref:Uncharacterized protein n=1 Tax=Nasonia vitripennis TaxID=7425 RepID=A0A7M7HFA1_NASVI|nr:uncharacterized protein LOC103317726 [Nasonia vitripennis]
MDKQKPMSAQGPNRDRHKFVYNLNNQYPNLKMKGSKEERDELLALKGELDRWVLWLRTLDYWRFPGKFQEIDATNSLIKYWTDKIDGRKLKDKYEFGVTKNNRKSNSEPSRIGPPDRETFENVVRMIEQLRTIWSVVKIKYAEAVANSSQSMDERILRCDGIFNFH